MNPDILVSIVNMKLRNDFKDLDDLVLYYDIKKDSLIEKLGEQDYIYSEEEKQFLIK